MSRGGDRSVSTATSRADRTAPARGDRSPRPQVADGVQRSAADAAATVAPRRDRRSVRDVLALQRLAGNRAATVAMRPIQRVGGWADADTTPGSGLEPGDAKTGWNTGEHRVGAIRRIPIDGLTGGLQSNPDESASARELTDESVAGAVRGPARPTRAPTSTKSTKAPKPGRGRAIALVPALIETRADVTVLLHLHGNTEFKSRDFAGWRQHKDSGEVRDVARDRVAQQIEAANSSQIVGLLPQGVNEARFGSIAPDAYIRDAFDRLTEIGAWKQAPATFQVVLSAHSGGGFTVGRMIDGDKGFELPANLKTLVLFEALHTKKGKFDQVEQFATWIKGRLRRLAAALADPALSAAEKQARLDGATQIRLYWDPEKSTYDAKYVRLQGLIDAWFSSHAAALGTKEKALRDLVVFIPKPKVTHEGLVRSGLTESLAAATGAHPLPASAPTSAPATTPTATGGKASGARRDPAGGRHRPEKHRHRDHPSTKTDAKDRPTSPPSRPDRAPAPADDGVADTAPVKAAKAARGAKKMTDDQRKAALDAALEQVTTQGSRADRTAVANTLRYNGFETDEAWWKGMVFNASFLDVPITPSGGEVPGVHQELYDRLQTAERKLVSRFPGLSKAQIAGKMGIYEISGVRVPKKATGGSLPSYHCFGLAIDINHPTNPFIGNMKPKLDANGDKKVSADEQANYDRAMQNRSPRIIERAMLLLHREQFNVEREVKVPRGPGSRTGRLWEIHHRASETLAAYLRLADEPDGATLRGLVDELRRTGDGRDLEQWKAQIASDKVQLGTWDFMHSKKPQKTGYMDLHKELVEALAEDGGLLWGGSYSTAKDMMHFDHRNGSISKRPPKGWKPPPKAG